MSGAFYPATVYGGPTESLYQLCRRLGRLTELRVLTTDANGAAARVSVPVDQWVTYESFSVYYCRRTFRHTVSTSFVRRLFSLVRETDVVHLTGVYSFPTLPTLLACRLMGKPLCWSPRGAFQQWEGSTGRYRKAVWNAMCVVLLPAHCVIHATSPGEAAESRDVIRDARIAVIANGVDLPAEVAGDNRSDFRLLFIGRLHPKKGLENLLSACAMLRDDAQRRWHLEIAGDGDAAYVRRLKQQVLTLGLRESVTWLGSVEGEAKRASFERCDVVVVPSHTENFGMVIAEALAYGKPVIAGRGTPWRDVEAYGCGLWVDNDPVSLSRAIIEMSTMPLSEMGMRGRKWMASDYRWEMRAAEMLRLYEHFAQAGTA